MKGEIVIDVGRPVLWGGRRGDYQIGGHIDRLITDGIVVNGYVVVGDRKGPLLELGRVAIRRRRDVARSHR
jgi:hypothetical protein